MKFLPRLIRPPYYLAAFAALLTIAASAFAADVKVTRELSEAEKMYTPISMFGPESVTSLKVPAAKLGKFNADFSVLGEENFVGVWRAPSRKLFEIVAPSAFDQGIQLRFEFQGGSQGGAMDFIDFASGVAFSRGTGDSPAPFGPNIVLADETGDVFIAQAMFDMNPGDVFRFKALTITSGVPVPANYDAVFTNRDIDFFILEGRAKANTGPPPPADPGQWVRLIADPRVAQVRGRLKRAKAALRQAKRGGTRAKANRFQRKVNKLKRELQAL